MKRSKMYRLALMFILPAVISAVMLTGCTIDITAEDAVKLYNMFNSLKDEYSEAGNEAETGQEYKIGYRLLDAKEGSELLLSNTQYYDKLTDENLRYRMQDKNADLNKYREFAAAQTRDFTEEEEKAIDDAISSIEERFEKIGFKWPIEDDILFVKTTMEEEPGAGGYTHKNQIYLGENVIEKYAFSDNEEYRDHYKAIVAHEISHVLTRNVPEFRKELYSLIGFSVDEKEPDFSDEVKAMILANPDVEAYDCHGQFTIDGKKTDATIVTKIIEPYEDGAVMLGSVEAALVPKDDPDHFVSIEDVPDFYDVVGRNTGYVIAAEECMADNFSYAVIYGLDHEYDDPEIIKGVLDIMSKD